MYEEATGEKLLIPNKYKFRAGATTAPKYLKLGKFDLIQPRVAEWAGLDSIMPKLPSYPRFGGVGIRSSAHTLNVIFNQGVFEEGGKARKTTNALDKFTELVEADL
jgi:hypothetical protein